MERKTLVLYHQPTADHHEATFESHKERIQHLAKPIVYLGYRLEDCTVYYQDIEGNAIHADLRTISDLLDECVRLDLNIVL